MWLKPAGGSGDQVLVGKHWNATMTSPYYQYAWSCSPAVPSRSS